MTNTVAFSLAGLVLIALAIDLILGLGGSLFLAKEFLALIEWVAFWR